MLIALILVRGCRHPRGAGELLLALWGAVIVTLGNRDLPVPGTAQPG